ncbi:MAG: hypothetical protein Kow00106_21800 [Anaerolineae bacterium]
MLAGMTTAVIVPTHPARQLSGIIIRGNSVRIDAFQMDSASRLGAIPSLGKHKESTHLQAYSYGFRI